MLNKQDFVSENGKINPLLGALDKARNTSISLGKALLLSPYSRRNLRVLEKQADDGAVDWTKRLEGPLGLVR